jgi:hypothetical protein
MKSFSLLVAFLSISLLAFGQKSVVSESEMKINGIPRTGQRVNIQLDTKTIEKAWAGLLKDKVGKVTSSKGVYTIENAKIESISKTPVRIISAVESTKEGTNVWWSIDLGNAYVSKDQTSKEYKAAAEYLKEFAREMYRQDVARQVADAEKVLAAAEMEHNRVIKSASDIQRSIEKNKSRKAELEAELARNNDELIKLNKDVETNLKAQEAARKEVDNMKKSVQVVKDKVHAID